MAKVIAITEENALKAYKNANKENKSFLEDLIGKENLQPKDIRKRLFTLEDACRETGKDISKIFHPDDDEYDRARKTLEIFAEALREGVSEKECFYYPWFDRSGGGFRFGGDVGDYDSSGVGARLRVPNSDKAEFFGKQMLDVWKIYINGVN